MGNQGDYWQTELGIFERNMYPMMYQELASMGVMVIERGGEMFPQSIKKSPKEETSDWNDRGTRQKHSQ